MDRQGLAPRVARPMEKRERSAAFPLDVACGRGRGRAGVPSRFDGQLHLYKVTPHHVVCSVSMTRCVYACSTVTLAETTCALAAWQKAHDGLSLFGHESWNTYSTSTYGRDAECEL
jgi:hypothetical protein